MFMNMFTYVGMHLPWSRSATVKKQGIDMYLSQQYIDMCDMTVSWDQIILAMACTVIKINVFYTTFKYELQYAILMHNGLIHGNTL